jgi:hypothetical protein
MNIGVIYHRKKILSTLFLETSEKVPQAQERRASKVLECGFLNLRQTIPVRNNQVI